MQAVDYLQKATYEQAVSVYSSIFKDANVDQGVLAYIGLYDRYFFSQVILNLGNVIKRSWHPWLYERCREVEQNPDGYIDLWAREHFKSTYITFAGSIQEVAKDPNLTVGIFSHNAKHSRSSFVTRIKRELEQNKLLQSYYSYVFYSNPEKEASVWSRNEGLICKRDSNPAEATFSGHGLVDGQPIGSHFGLLIYDDVVTDKSVGTPEMIIKTTDMWDLSQFLGKESDDGTKPRVWYIGTRYNYADTYKTILDRKVAIPRIHAATADGTPDGTPVFLTKEQWATKKQRSSKYMIACQMLQNPLAGDEVEFKLEYIRRYEVRPDTLNVVIVVDPAGSLKKTSSDTAMWVIGVDAHYNKYLLDGAVHKMKLSDRWRYLKNFRFKWIKTPGIQTVKVGYEKYGLQSDIEHFEQMMKIEKCPFPILPLSWPRDSEEGSKLDRIRRLLPDHENWRFFYPYEGPETKDQRKARLNYRGHLVAKVIKQVNEDKRVYNPVQYLINNEMIFFPATTKLDGLDALSRIYDMDIHPPMKYSDNEVYPEAVGDD